MPISKEYAEVHMKNVKYILIALIVSLFVVLIKNIVSSRLVSGSSGMPGVEKMGEVDNLFVGSSVFKQGLDIKELESFSSSSFILAYNGNQPFAIYEELKKV